MKQQDLKLDIKFLVDRINNIAQMVIDMMLSNTAKGKSYINDGIDFPAYSRKPFSQPYGSFLRDVQGWPGYKTYANEHTKSYSDKSGQEWIIHKDGYAVFKSNRWPDQNGVVNLEWRGRNRGGMLSSIAIINKATNSNVVATIGFTNAENHQLALYHERMGASKSRVIRPFFGITKQQRAIIMEELKNAVELSKSTT